MTIPKRTVKTMDLIKKIKALSIFLILISLNSIYSINFQKPKTNLNCKLKNGYYTQSIAIGENILIIHIEITDESANFHRVINKYYVKNKINWISDCQFELITQEITDPILVDVDWIGNTTYYKVAAIDKNLYSYIKIEKNETPQQLKYQGTSFPHETND
ncbi:hypothetical protein [Leptospira terpstrae]|uniref:Uncharacterized protein n=1 Tax=Leptospira terpstrae serovar Hualin str. LT 11-33 = ATCC 700639 TaxID=1257025 RepID=N1VUG9_9LEPT|nr:hypothetical protein [Leptospira terpstrae]EMY62108.1 hypothetical protein LEP1GSC203_3622 [Leptospira terpstrae serovar Hualin str. LT 11-33 = ATCC 700639]